MREHRVLDKWQKAEIEFQDFAYFQCKSKKEWKDNENNMTKAKYSSLRYKSIEELKERYADKVARKYEIDLYWEKQIKNYEEKVKRLKVDIIYYEKCGFRKRLRKAKNQLVCANKNLFYFEFCRERNQKKITKYEYLSLKWTGILEKIILSSIFNEIENEKRDLVAPKYGFGKPREESKFIHED